MVLSFKHMAIILKVYRPTEQASELMIKDYYVTNLTLLKQQEKFNMLYN